MLQLKVANMNQIFQDFLTIVTGIIVEALPFLIIGVIVSVFVDLFVKPEWLLKILPSNRFLSHPFIALFGILMPVCECGNVPVARRLLMYRMKPSQVFTFLLAAPVINPITFYSTMEAFNFDHNVAVFRISGAFFIATFIGIILSFHKDQDSFVTSTMKDEIVACEKDHKHESHATMFMHGIDTFQKEFINTLRLLIIGASIAATTQTIVPRSILEDIGSSPVLSVIAMLLLAFVISICANVDAFFALSYVNTFTLGSLVTFMVFGPMIDIKMITMLKNTFKLNIILTVSIIVAIYSALIGLAINYFYL